MHKASVIVPVYNTENYLERCIVSIINQSYHSIEINQINETSRLINNTDRLKSFLLLGLPLLYVQLFYSNCKTKLTLGAKS